MGTDGDRYWTETWTFSVNPPYPCTQCSSVLSHSEARLGVGEGSEQVVLNSEPALRPPREWSAYEITDGDDVCGVGGYSIAPIRLSTAFLTLTGQRICFIGTLTHTDEGPPPLLPTDPPQAAVRVVCARVAWDAAEPVD